MRTTPRSVTLGLSIFILVALLGLTTIASAQLVRSATGSNAADPTLNTAISQFRLDLGTLNPNVVGSFGSGRREINWDGVPDAFAAPNNLPANFFNSNSPRGVVFSTAGSGFQVSANAVNSFGAPVQFGNINANYPSLFEPFSQQRLFTALGSNIMDVSFFVPGTNTPALTTGFGAIFSDVDLSNTSSIAFFGVSNTLLGTFFVPSISGNETFSFLGVSFGSAVVSRVRITSGNQILGAGNNTEDLVVMDDFIFGETNAIPEGGTTLALLGVAFAVLAAVRARQQRLVPA